MSTASLELPLESAPAPSPRSEMWLFAWQYRWSICWTYLLFVVENTLRLAQPLLIGWAINDLLKSSYVGLGVYIAGHVLHMTTKLIRQMYDTRAFTAIYSDRVSRLVLDQRANQVDVSKVAARSVLTREFVEFFERQMQIVIQALFSLFGAIVILMFFDWLLVVFCLALVGPSLILNYKFGRRSIWLSGMLHDQLEREVDVMHEPNKETVQAHYQAVARWRVRLSDCEAYTAGIMELFVMALLIGALVRFCMLPHIMAGDIFAVFRYVLLFVTALDRVPQLVQQVSRLMDIGGRIGEPNGEPKLRGRKRGFAAA